MDPTAQSIPSGFSKRSGEVITVFPKTVEYWQRVCSAEIQPTLQTPYAKLQIWDTKGDEQILTVYANKIFSSGDGTAMLPANGATLKVSDIQAYRVLLHLNAYEETWHEFIRPAVMVAGVAGLATLAALSFPPKRDIPSQDEITRLRMSTLLQYANEATQCPPNFALEINGALRDTVVVKGTGADIMLYGYPLLNSQMNVMKATGESHPLSVVVSWRKNELLLNGIPFSPISRDVIAKDWHLDPYYDEGKGVDRAPERPTGDSTENPIIFYIIDPDSTQTSKETIQFGMEITRRLIATLAAGITTHAGYQITWDQYAPNRPPFPVCNPSWVSSNYERMPEPVAAEYRKIKI